MRGGDARSATPAALELLMPAPFQFPEAYPLASSAAIVEIGLLPV